MSDGHEPLTADDRAQIHQVLADYGHIVDDHDWDRAGDVFADDFVFDMSGLGQPDLHGVADLVATFKGRNLFAHHTTNVTIAVDADGTVRVHSKWLGFANDGVPRTGDYHDVVVRTAAGWRLHRRRATTRARQFFD